MIAQIPLFQWDMDQTKISLKMVITKLEISQSSNPPKSI